MTLSILTLPNCPYFINIPCLSYPSLLRSVVTQVKFQSIFKNFDIIIGSSYPEYTLIYAVYLIFNDILA